MLKFLSFLFALFLSACNWTPAETCAFAPNLCAILQAGTGGAGSSGNSSGHGGGGQGGIDASVPVAGSSGTSGQGGQGGQTSAGNGGIGGNAGGGSGVNQAGNGSAGSAAGIGGQGGSASGSMQLGTNLWYLAPWSGQVTFVPSVNWATAYSSGVNIWNSAFTSELAPYSVIRFLDWGNTNHSQLTSWSQRRLPTDPGNA